jgi:Spy/CpxP family protein refolding chaperone
MTMDSISKNKWQVRAAVVIIFVLGAATGVLGTRFYYAWMRAGGATRGQDRFERLFDRLQLNAEQKTQVQQILTETRERLHALRVESEPRYREIKQQTDERLKQVLTPEQWEKFQQMKEEMRSRRRYGRDRDRGGGSSHF